MLHVMEYSTWKDRAEVTTLTKSTADIAHSENYYRWMCQRLEKENFLHVPDRISINSSWKSRFLDMYKMRNYWSPLGEQNVVERRDVDFNYINKTKINVFARFRPLPKSCQESMDDNKENIVEVTLPLHQRLRMIKMSHNIKSNKKALKVLAAEGGWFHNKWSCLAKESPPSAKRGKYYKDTDYLNIENSESDSYHGYNPSLSGISVEKTTANIETIDPEQGRVVVVAPDIGLREFRFDGVFSEQSQQHSLYDECIRHHVHDLFNGFNATALVYGQTGSGKSFTMFGSDEESIFNCQANGKGIIPRACEDVISIANTRQKRFGIDYLIYVSYVEVFGDFVSDLLKMGERVGHSMVSSHRYVLSGAAETMVESMEDIYELLKAGENQKRRAATAMNDRSTRAHSIFILRLEQINPQNGVKRSSKLFMADLGGSEQVKKSKIEAGSLRVGADENFSAGFEMADRMREAVNINLGLLALKKCIEALNNQSPYIPYQDSKLTMLLSDGLGGNSKTSVIICSRMESAHISESVATLRFGERCSLIEKEARNNASMLANVLAKIDREIHQLEETIRAKERWVEQKEKRQDELAEEGTLESALGGVEIHIVTKLTGAEEERKELEALLKKRAKYAGTDFLSLDDQSKSKVLGFGKEMAELYGLGAKFDIQQDLETINERFEDTIATDTLPMVLQKQGVSWVTGDSLQEDPHILEKRAKKVRRNKLRFAGLSL